MHQAWPSAGLLPGMELGQGCVQRVQPGLVHSRMAMVGAVPIVVPQVAAG